MIFLSLLPFLLALFSYTNAQAAGAPVDPSSSKSQKKILPHVYPLFPTKINMTGYLRIIKNNPSVTRPRPSRKTKERSVFQNLENAYADSFYNFVKQARSLATEVEDGMSEVLPACDSCKGNILGKERTQCYASCITRQMDSFAPYALLIGEAVQNFFCIPLGFGFESHFLNPHPPRWLFDFYEFVELFNANEDSFSRSSLVETWMSNVLWLDKSPLYLHSFIRSRLAVDIAETQATSNLKAKPTTETAETPAKFAEKCGSKWDLREVVYSLVNAAKEKSTFLEVVLRGLYSVRSAAFYTLGEYHNLAGGILEGLNALAGTKCDLISYSDGEHVTNTSCDGVGRWPVPQFPVPPLYAKFLQPCEYDRIPIMMD